MSGSIITAMVGQDRDPWMPQEQDLFPDALLRKGVPDARMWAESTVNLLAKFGTRCDTLAEQQIRDECESLSSIGYDGRIYPKITSMPEGKDVERVQLLTRGVQVEKSRTISFGEIPQMRIAFYRAHDDSTVDPIVHYLNLSYAHHAQGINSSFYQPQAFEVTQKKFETSNDFLLDVSTPDEVFVWIAQDVCHGIPLDSPDFVMQEGLMRPPTRFFSNYGKTGFDFYAAMGVSKANIYRQECDGACFPFIGYGGVVAFKGDRQFG